MVCQHFKRTFAQAQASDEPSRVGLPTCGADVSDSDSGKPPNKLPMIGRNLLQRAVWMRTGVLEDIVQVGERIDTELPGLRGVLAAPATP